MAYKGYKFRMYPNQEQQERLAKTFDATRFLYNAMLEDKIKYYEKTGKTLNKQADPYIEANPWLQEVDRLALYKAKYNLDDAWKVFLDNKKNGYPKFKSRHNHLQRYRTNNRNKIKVSKTHILLPGIGSVKVKLHRLFPRQARLIEVCVRRVPSGKYFATVLFEYPNSTQRVVPKTFLGLDFATQELYVDSEGRSANYPQYFQKSYEKLAREQRKLDKMQFRSNNWEKQRVKLARIHEKIFNQRKDFLDKLSTKLADNYDCICVEDLDLEKIKFQSHRLTSRSLLDSSYGVFIKMLDYKLRDRGKQLIKINRYFPSSQLCNQCGYRNYELKDTTIRHWTCPKCGAELDRDHNAAINIRNEGIKKAGG